MCQIRVVEVLSGVQVSRKRGVHFKGDMCLNKLQWLIKSQSEYKLTL